MVFKLVRIDTENPFKIDLSIGKHVIGRGKFLHNDDADKRVSRNHAELEVTEDNITLKSLHKNPCFYIKKTVPDTLLLHQDCSISLHHGDRFGLIPDHFWYEILYFTQDNAPESVKAKEIGENGVANQQEQEIKLHGVTDKPNENGIAEEVNQETNHDLSNEEKPQSDVTKDLNQDTVKNEVANESNVEINENQGAEATQAMEEAAHCTDNAVEHNNPVNNDAKTDEDDQTQCTEEYDPGLQTPSKRSHSDSTESSPVQEKKVKTEPVEVKTEPVEVKTEPDDASNPSAGPSNDDQCSSNTDTTDRPASPQKPNPPIRERCIYGANCYRRNPQHKAQFSHPTDSDWGTGERGVCPYGRHCRRTDPRHWDTHDHPPGTQPGDGGNRPGMRVVRRHGNVFFINAHTVNFYDDHFQVEDSDTDGESVDYDYEF